MNTKLNTMNPKLAKALADWPLWPFAAAPIRAEQVSRLNGGLTNECYLLTLDCGQYVLRVAGGAELDINREAEYQIHSLLAARQLTPAVRYKAADNSYWLRDFVQGESLSAADLHIPNLHLMLAALQQVHRLKPLPEVPVLSINAKAEQYWQTINGQYTVDFSALKSALQQQFQHAPSPELCLCHMDPTPGNWIKTSAGLLVLLDWEYAALGHPWWDIAAVLQDAPLSAEDEGAILSTYGITAAEPGWQLAKAQMRYLTVLWYGAQHSYSSTQLHQALTALLA